MKKAIQLEDAIELILTNTAVMTETESVRLTEALGRVVAVPYQASLDQPPFDRSPLDGYALHSADIAAASAEQPVELAVIETVYAGDVPKQTVRSGQAVRIMTGAMLPAGADCVIRQEDTETIAQTQRVRICMPLRTMQNICRRGEDIQQGAFIMEKGTAVTPAHAAVLAGQGILHLTVFRRIRAAILATGSELISEQNQQTEQNTSGMIHDTNGPMLAMRLAQLGIEAGEYSISDEPQLLRAKLEELLEEYDAVITTGGVSVGDKDYIPAVMRQMEAKVLFHGVDMKPGTPMLAAQYHGKMIFCLSGNPFAAAATMELAAVPGLLKMCGLQYVYPRRFRAALQNDFPKNSIHKRRFIRAQRTENGIYVPDKHSSGSLFSLIGCDCLVDIPEGSGQLSAGESVQAVELADIYHTGSCWKYTSLPSVLCICGRKNVGKTTFLEALLPHLIKKGIEVGVLKHDGHDFVPDVPGTDSFRYRQAGAEATAVFSDRRQSYYTGQAGADFQTVCTRLCHLSEKPLQLILVEGLKNSDYDKIEIMRREISEESIVHGGRLLAVCADFPPFERAGTQTTGETENMLPQVFGLQDQEAVADYILRWLNLQDGDHS